MNLIEYPVPPTKLLQIHFRLYVNTSHLFSLAPHLIKILSYEPLGKLLEFKSIAKELCVFMNSELDASLTESRSKNIIQFT